MNFGLDWKATIELRWQLLSHFSADASHGWNYSVLGRYLRTQLGGATQVPSGGGH